MFLLQHNIYSSSGEGGTNWHELQKYCYWLCAAKNWNSLFYNEFPLFQFPGCVWGLQPSSSSCCNQLSMVQHPSLICFKNFIQSHITEILNISIRSFKWGGGRGRKKIWMSVANRPKHWRIKDTSIIAVPSQVSSFWSLCLKSVA